MSPTLKLAPVVGTEMVAACAVTVMVAVLVNSGGFATLKKRTWRDPGVTLGYVVAYGVTTPVWIFTSTTGETSTSVRDSSGSAEVALMAGSSPSLAELGAVMVAKGGGPVSSARS